MSDGWLNYGLDVWHCEACHRVVRTYDSNNPAHKRNMLSAHRAFNCVTDPLPHLIREIA